LVKAIHLARSISEDASIFEQAAEHVPDLEHQIARAGLVIDSRALSSDEASAYINDMLVELKGENADIEAFTTRRSPAAENSPMNSDAEISLLPGGSDTTSVKNGSDVSVADGVAILNITGVKKEKNDEEEFPDFDEQED
jgi:hypothetical protein